jgi:PilZ domain
MRGTSSTVTSNLGYQRRSERTRVELAVTLLIPRPGTDDLVDRVLTSDFSNFGARVICEAALVPGQKVRFIPRNADHPSLAVPSRVVWVGEAGSDRSGQVGIEFLVPMGW